MYYGFINAKDVALITTLDTYHSFWFHSLNLYKLDAEKSYKALRSLDDDCYIDMMIINQSIKWIQMMINI